MSAERRAVAASLLFLASGALAGTVLRPQGVEYRTFGVVETLLALLFTYIFLLRGVWRRPPGWIGWVPVAYGTGAGAQLLALLLPPPGVVQWVVVVGLSFSVWAALGSRSRTRLIGSLASLALLLALLNFSVIPFLWHRAGPDPGTAWGLGDLAEGFRRLFVEYEPIRASGQLVGSLALACWAAATRLLWEVAPARPEEG